MSSFWKVFLEEQKDASVAQRVSAEESEQAIEGGEEIVFVERAVQSFSSAHQLLEHGVGDGDPLQQQMAAGKAVT